MEEIKKTDSKSWYKLKFDEFEKLLNGESKSFLHRFRRNSIKSLEESNFPTQRDEDWKYTNVSPITKENFVPAVLGDNTINIDLKSYSFEVENSALFVFVNGILDKNLSALPNQSDFFAGSINELALIDETKVRNIFENNFSKQNSFDYLNESFGLDAFALIVPDKVIVENPIQVLFINGNGKEKVLSAPRIFVQMGKHSEANVIINFAGLESQTYFSNVYSSIQLDENSILNFFKVQNESKNSYHIDTTNINQKANSTLNHYNISFGGKLSRNGLNANLIGENAECNFNGLYIANENQHVDNHTFVNHAVPNCNSNETYKGILDDAARGVFNGKILVAKDAQKTNAYQSNKTILLSEKARIDTKPQLEIFADDVKCSHGATVGRLDQNALFYIISRGIPADLAKSMLIRAFANDVIEKISLPEFKEQLNHMIFRNLHRTEI